MLTAAVLLGKATTVCSMLLVIISGQVADLRQGLLTQAFVERLTQQRSRALR